jgi:hypothetical protein
MTPENTGTSEEVFMGRLKCLGIVVLLAVFHSAAAKDRFGIDPKRSIIFIESQEIKADDANSVKVRTGTGFIIKENGSVITAAHVLFEEEPGFVYRIFGSFGSRGNPRYPLVVVDADSRLDIALLSLPEYVDVDLQPLALGDSEKVKVGDKLFAYGFPTGLDLSLKDGVLSSRVAEKGQWQTTLGLNRGQSGGPVLNEEGEWVAIAVAGNESKNSVSFAVPETRSENIRRIAEVRSQESRVIASQNSFFTDSFFVYSSATSAFSAQRLCLPSEFWLRSAKRNARGNVQAGPEVKLVLVRESPNCVDAYPQNGATMNAIQIDLIGEKPEVANLPEIPLEELLREKGG